MWTDTLLCLLHQELNKMTISTIVVSLFHLFYFLEFDLRFCGLFMHFLLLSTQINNFASLGRNKKKRLTATQLQLKVKRNMSTIQFWDWQPGGRWRLISCCCSSAVTAVLNMRRRRRRRRRGRNLVQYQVSDWPMTTPNIYYDIN